MPSKSWSVSFFLLRAHRHMRLQLDFDRWWISGMLHTPNHLVRHLVGFLLPKFQGHTTSNVLSITGGSSLSLFTFFQFWMPNLLSSDLLFSHYYHQNDHLQVSFHFPLVPSCGSPPFTVSEQKSEGYNISKWAPMNIFIFQPFFQ